MAETSTSKGNRGRWVLAVLCLLAVALLLAWRFLPVGRWLGGALQAISDLGPLGPVVLGVVYVVATLLFVPGLILTIGAGAVFGVALGTVTVSIASTIGAGGAFLIGRYLARGAVEAWLVRYPRFAAIDRAVGVSGWKIVGLVRLSPLFPFNLMNYAFGLTRIPFIPYLAASWAGMLPGTLLYVYIGAVLGDLAAVTAGQRSKTPLEFGFYIVGLLLTVVVTFYVTRIARQALQRVGVEDDTDG